MKILKKEIENSIYVHFSHDNYYILCAGFNNEGFIYEYKKKDNFII